MVDYHVETLTLPALDLVHQSGRHFLWMLFQHMFQLLFLGRDQFEEFVDLSLGLVLDERLLALHLNEEVLVVLILAEFFAGDFGDGGGDDEVGFGRVGADFVGGDFEGCVARGVVLFV